MENKVIWRAYGDSRHFTFTAYGNTEGEALRAFTQGIRAHGGDPEWQDEMIDEVNIRPFRIGGCYRDNDYDLLAKKQ